MYHATHIFCARHTHGAARNMCKLWGALALHPLVACGALWRKCRAQPPPGVGCVRAAESMVWPPSACKRSWGYAPTASTLAGSI